MSQFETDAEKLVRLELDNANLLGVIECANNNTHRANERVALLLASRDALLDACRKTIAENLGLADGDICSLIHLKRAIVEAEGRA